MSEMIAKVIYEMGRFTVEEQTDGTFSVHDLIRCANVREGLTANDEPLDICDDMNARAIIGALSIDDLLAELSRRGWQP